MVTIQQHDRAAVVAQLPRAGLGNSLLVWAKAALFAHLNDLPLRTLGWHRLYVGPLLRGERSRFYGGYFKSEGSALERLELAVRLRIAGHEQKLFNPSVARRQAAKLHTPRWVIFDAIPHWSDYFGELKAHRQFVRTRLHEQLRTSVRRELASCTPPVIGVHARLGDFRPLKPGEDFAKVGCVRTPQQYFIDVIQGIRQAHGAELPVTVFSDGKPHELGELLSLPGVTLAPPRPSIVDLLLLARSQVIVASAGSSFSAWAGFLSDSPVIFHPNHIHARIRPEGSELHEGPPSDAYFRLIAQRSAGRRSPAITPQGR
jgi:hypothetical protein